METVESLQSYFVEELIQDSQKYVRWRALHRSLTGFLDKPVIDVCQGPNRSSHQRCYIKNGIPKACIRYFLRNFYFLPNDRPSKTMKDVFYFI